MALKVGTEDRKKLAIAGALVVVVTVLVIRTLFLSPDNPAPATAARTSPPVASARQGGVAPGAAVRTSTQVDPTLHTELMAENESFLYHGSGRNIFSANSAPPPAAVKIEALRAPIRPTVQVAQAPAGPPPPPAIDLRFFGYSARKDGTRKAFLLHGEDVFIASEGDVVSHRYRVVKIAATSVQVEDLPYHNTQSLPLVQN